MRDKRARVHVVDDDPDTLLFLFDLLSNAGYQVSASSSPAEALAYISRTAPEVVLTDLQMPKLSGLELLDHIKQSSPKTCVLLMSVAQNEPLKDEAFRKGADGFLCKPFTISQILTAVEQGCPARPGPI